MHRGSEAITRYLSPFPGSGSRAFRFGMDPAFHLARPLQKSAQLAAFAPHELPEFQEANLRHLDPGVGFNAPEQIGTAPRSKAMAFGGVPQKANLVAHASIINTKGRKGIRA